MIAPASSSRSGSVICVCGAARLKYYGCLCGAEIERAARGIHPDDCVVPDGRDRRPAEDKQIGQSHPSR